MESYKTAQVEVFRLGVEQLLREYADRTKIAVAKNKALGMSARGMRTMKDSDRTKWAATRAILNRDIKRKVAGLILLIHNSGSMKDLR